MKALLSKYEEIEQLSEDSHGKYEPVPGKQPREAKEAWDALTEAIQWRTAQLNSKQLK